MAHILIMEDDAEQAELLADAVDAYGHTVVTTASATEAWQRLQNEVFDLLITDILVEKDGSYVDDGGILLIGRCRIRGRVGRLKALERMPIIAITGARLMSSSTDILSLSSNLGADLCLQKPIDIGKLGDSIRKLLAGG